MSSPGVPLTDGSAAPDTSRTMTKASQLMLVCGALFAAACGDNGNECGAGTEERDGQCVAVGDPVQCTGGTILDEATNSCVIDPSACQDGTVLVNNQCVDPNTEVTADVTEGAEPNGLGVGEPSTTPAGQLELKAVGAGALVVKGNLNPRADRDDDGQPEPDYDTYLFEVQGPTLLDISVDGVGGAAGAFAILGDGPGLGDWIRLGVNTAGDTSKRQVFLPGAGVYVIAVADTRTLLTSLPVGDADNAYYLSISNIAIPAPTPVPLTNGTGTVETTIASGEVKFFTAALDTGLNDVSMQTDHPDYEGSIVAVVNNELHSLADEVNSNPGGDFPAELVVGGVDAGDTTLLAVDSVTNLTTAPVNVEVSVTTASSVALSTTGTMATGDAVVNAFTFFHFDAAAANEILGLDIAWTEAVRFQIANQRGELISAGTFSRSATATTLGYQGLFRAPEAGRYYLVANDPTAATGDDIIATSTITAVTPVAQTFDTPTAATAPNAFNAVALDYMVSGEDWQEFNLSANAASGGAYAYYYDAASAYGMLNDIPLVGGNVAFSDPLPLVELVAPPDDSDAVGLIIPTPPSRMLGVVWTEDNAGTFTAEVERRDYTDKGSVAAGTTVSDMNQTLDAMTTEHLYFIESTPRNTISITATPQGLLDVSLQVLNTFETAAVTRNTGLGGVAESTSVVVPSSGWVAVRVVGTGLLSTGTFNISFNVSRPAYLVNGTTTAWTNICSAGMDVTPANNDEGITAPITIPAMDFFSGANLTEIRISTNGWLTFDPTVTAPTPVNGALPNASAPNGLVAAYWDDLTRVRICTQQSGTKFIVQWRGELKRANASSPSGIVGVQAILDASNDSIEFVYAPYMTATGASGTGGIEDLAGNNGIQLFRDQANGLTPGSSRRLTR